MCRKNSTNNLVADVRKIIEIGRGQAYAAASYAAITTYWSIGRRIVEEEQGGQARADYGKGIIKNLAEALVPVYGRYRELLNFRKCKKLSHKALKGRLDHRRGCNPRKKCRGGKP